jgi:hypothetical protein
LRAPFTVGEFFDVFARYNAAVWPMQLVLLALALAALVLVHLREKGSSRAVALILTFLWGWMGLAYHFAYFAAINPAAKLFGTLFLAQAVLFLWLGGFRTRLAFGYRRGLGLIIGWVLIAYSLLIYPILGRFAGHAYMSSPTFGAPCPTVIFTFGLMWFARRPFPRYALVIPLIWSVIGGSAAFTLGVPQDLGLVVAGITGLALLFMRTDEASRG